MGVHARAIVFMVPWVILWVARSVFYSMSLPLALCQWRRNSQLQVHKRRYRGLLVPGGVAARLGGGPPGKWGGLFMAIFLREGMAPPSRSLVGAHDVLPPIIPVEPTS